MVDHVSTNELLRQLRKNEAATAKSDAPIEQSASEPEVEEKEPVRSVTPIDMEVHFAREKALLEQLESEQKARKLAEDRAKLLEKNKKLQEVSVKQEQGPAPSVDQIIDKAHEVTSNSALLDEVALSKTTASSPLSDLSDFSFGDMFVRDSNNQITYQKGRDVTIKRIQEAILLQAMEDTRKRYVGSTVRIGSITHTVTNDNKVFTTQVSFARYSLMMNMAEDLRIKLARQMFLAKYPDGESELFNDAIVRGDEFDVYKLILVSSKATASSMDQVLERLLLDVRKIKDTTSTTQSMVSSNNKWLRRKLHGLSHAISWLFLDRTALTKGQLPKTIEDAGRTVADVNIMKATKLFDLVGEQQSSRDDTIERTNRLKKPAPIKQQRNENDGPSL